MAVDSTTLGTYLGAEVDDARATELIGLATSLCKATIGLADADALPAGTDAVVLSAAARAYLNPASTTAQLAGPYQMSGATGGIYLTRAERSSLRRLAGRTGAYSVDLIPGYPDARFPDAP